MLRKGDGYYNEHHYRCYIYGGTNIGEEREVSDWTLTSPAATLTFDPAFTTAIDVTSQYELHYIFTEDEYRKAINMAINALAGKYLIAKTNASITLVDDIYEYTLPDGFEFIDRIITEDEEDSGIFYADDVIDSRDWGLISPRKLKLHESRYSITEDKDLKIEGQGRQETVNADSDVIYLPPDWLVAKAITMLPKNKIMSNKLDATYHQALLDASKEPSSWPNPTAQRVI